MPSFVRLRAGKRRGQILLVAQLPYAVMVGRKPIRVKIRWQAQGGRAVSERRALPARLPGRQLI
jgi:hypothetical protein